mmetsp:Transcript_17675/g.49413  ORF Transcript_17675/g.49413 Transcript_17675/m.49413 type:complete len:795 (+) Transcript_17675:280-2664(+)
MQQALQGLSYMTWQLEVQQPRVPADLDSTPFTFVDNTEELDLLVKSLGGAREIAVDLEAHHYRSFLGFTCLIQLSTRECDWVVDTLALRDLVGPKLGPVFADAGVQKVLHGAEYDVQWLQRDFGIYIVNMFDTGQAARVLELPSFGLAFLMNHYCSTKVDKRYQMADWRLRPLPEDMLHYARMDTHFLLYISDRLKAELLAKPNVSPELRVPIRACAAAPDNALGITLERSWKLCLKLFQKELHDDTAYIKDLGKCKGELVTREQTAVYAALFNWRDKIAREADESLGYVIPRGTMIDLAQQAPTTRSQLLTGRSLSPLAAQHADILVKLISDAKRQAGAGDPPASSSDMAASKESAVATEILNILAVTPSSDQKKTEGGAEEALPGAAGPFNAPKNYPAANLASAGPPDLPAVATLKPAKPIVVHRAGGGSALGGLLAGGGKARPFSAPQGQNGDRQGGTSSAPIPTSSQRLAAKPISVGGSGGGSLLGALLGGKPSAVVKVAAFTGSASQPTLEPRSTGTALPMRAVSTQREPNDSAQPHMAPPQFTLPFALVPKPSSAPQTADEAHHPTEGDKGLPMDVSEDPADEAGSNGYENKGASVSEWLALQRQQQGQSVKGTQEPAELSASAASAGDSEPKPSTEYEDYLPMSLNETYKKHGKGGQRNRSSAERGGSGDTGSGPTVQTGSGRNVVPFDYASMAANNPSLSAAFKPQLAGSKWRSQQGGRGRNGRGRGRGRGDGRGAGPGGRGSSASRATASNQRRGMHEMNDNDLLKGGKRSTLFPRSGNRTASFK